VSEAHPQRLVLRGFEAVLACLRHHPKALREVAASAEAAPRLAEHDEAFAQLGVRTRVAGPAELAQLAEGPCDDVCAVTQRPELGLARVGDFAEWRQTMEPIVIADSVADPADLAAIARAMAAFGVERLLLSGGTEKLAYHPEAWRLARGALEQLRLTRAAALGGLLKLVEDRCCVVALSPDHGRRIDLGVPVRVPGRHLALLIPGGRLDPDLQARIEHCFRFPGLVGQPALSLAEIAPLALAWFASAPRPRADGFLARKRARHAKGKESNPSD
jgi:tRNA G18 (ribose-2'-O)-methylase SpoU